MKRAKIIFTLLILVITTFSSTTDSNTNITGEILFKIGDQTAVYNNAKIILSSSGWTGITAQVKNDEGIIIDNITFSFQGNTPGEYGRFDENVHGNYANGNLFNLINKSRFGWFFRVDDIKTKSFLVSEIGENKGDVVSGTFSGLINIDGAYVNFTGAFNFLR